MRGRLTVTLVAHGNRMGWCLMDGGTVINSGNTTRWKSWGGTTAGIADGLTSEARHLGCQWSQKLEPPYAYRTPTGWNLAIAGESGLASFACFVAIGYGFQRDSATEPMAYINIPRKLSDPREAAIGVALQLQAVQP